MKVYAVVEKIGDEYDADYDVVIENHVYLYEDDAKERLEELSKERRWLEYEICEFEVKE